MKITIIYKNQQIEIPVKKVSGLGKIVGLMFKSKKTENLLFVFGGEMKMKIHSYFVFFDFLAIWVDEKNNVIEWKFVKPFTLFIKPRKSFIKLIEIPINKKNRKIIEFFVGNGKI